MLAISGLSPLARGTRNMIRAVSLVFWFIPAGAGNTTSEPLARSTLPVYPRWRGEHLNEGQQAYPAGGLSPLARGTLLRGGKRQDDRAVYPRWRGEHVDEGLVTLVLIGLSPLARGTL